MPANPEPSEAEIQEALHHAEDGDWEGRFCHSFCKSARKILARAFRAKREKVKRIEAERQDLRAELVRLHGLVCEEDAQSIETILGFHDRKAKALRSGVREGA